MTYPWISIEQNVLTCPDGHRVKLHAYSISPELAPQIAVLGGLLSASECDRLIALSAARLQLAEAEAETEPAAAVSIRAVGPSERVRHVDFARAEDDLIATVEARIAALSQWPADDAYRIRVTRYRARGPFERDRIAEDPPYAARDERVDQAGPAIATVVMYLSEGADAGVLSFSRSGLTVCAHKGNALFFNDPDLGEAGGGHGELDAVTIPAGDTWLATMRLARKSVG